VSTTAPSPPGLGRFLRSGQGWPYLLTPFILIAVFLEAAGAQPALVFFASAAGVIPTAALMGRATEELADRSGPGIGGLLNVTFGNAPELIIALFALGQGLHEVVKASLREKEILLKEIHHRVKNNLQITSSLLRLQASRIPVAEAQQFLRESQDRIRSMALVHEMLYRSDDLARVDFAAYTRSLVQQLMRSYGVDVRRLAHVVEVEDILLGIDEAVPCGLIINELVANALKHAFPADRAGRIWVRMGAEDRRFILRVGDDGVGIPDRIDFRESQTLGLQLVRTLTDQLEGTVTLDRAGGTHFTIIFPRRSGVT